MKIIYRYIIYIYYFKYCKIVVVYDYMYCIHSCSTFFNHLKSVDHYTLSVNYFLIIFQMYHSSVLMLSLISKDIQVLVPVFYYRLLQCLMPMMVLIWNVLKQLVILFWSMQLQHTFTVHMKQFMRANWAIFVQNKYSFYTIIKYI